jgi:hypothetical protein
VAPLPSSTIVKMEDRKRTASQSVDELAPPTKRQAVNGASKASADSDMPWKDDLEVSVTRPPHHLPISTAFPLILRELVSRDYSSASTAYYPPCMRLSLPVHVVSRVLAIALRIHSGKSRIVGDPVSDLTRHSLQSVLRFTMGINTKAISSDTKKMQSTARCSSTNVRKQHLRRI